MKTAPHVASATARPWFPLVILLLLAALQPLNVLAHGTGALFVPRQDASRPAPTVDGVCERGEYINGYRYSRILYTPALPGFSATLNLIATERDLYVCIANMPRHFGADHTTISLSFDTEHEGGRVPDRNDLRLSMTETGTTTAFRGTGSGGFARDEPLAGWVGRTSGDDFYWSAEFRVPFTLLGRTAPSSIIGFHVRHSGVRAPGDGFSWPRGALETNPDTWADLLWLPVTLTPQPVRVDVARITQGLEVDPSSGTPYDYIAGKDTLVRAQLYSLGPIRSLRNAACAFRRVAPSPGPETIWASDPLLRSVINAFPRGFFNGSPVVDCWIPGAFVAQPGEYEFKLRLEMDGTDSPVFIPLGTRVYRETRDLCLLLIPWDDTAPVPPARPWDADLSAVLPQAMSEMNRIYPLRSGSGVARLFPGTAQGGLRYTLWPGGTCRTGETLMACDRRKRTYANDQLERLNAVLRGTDGATRRDHFDFHVVLTAATSAFGGQAQFTYSPCSSGTYFDNDPAGASATIIAQEVGHCLGQVSPASPHHDGSGHSLNANIVTALGLPVVNMLTRADVPNAFSMLFPLVGGAPMSFTEGDEWNDLRRAIVVLSPPAARLALHDVISPLLFRFVGGINKQGEVTLDYSQRLTDLSLPLTPPAPGSPYEVRFLAQDGKALSELPFAVEFQATHHDQGEPEPEEAPLLLTVSLPNGAASVEIRRSGQVLFVEKFSAQAPVIASITATEIGNSLISLKWQSSDPDSQQLTCNLILSTADNDETPRVVATGLRESEWVLDTRFLPASLAARVTVEASDGLNVGRKTSSPFVIAPQPPAIRIVAPSVKDSVVAGQPVVLMASSFDYTDGQLAGDSLTWTSDKTGALGTGERLVAQLPAGTHQLTVTGINSAQIKAAGAITINVLADTDGDGLPDEFEAKYPCLSATTFDSNDDPDGDGLTSLVEFKRGPSPCAADTDLDGFDDGEEYQFGGDPLDPKRHPLPNLLFVSDEPVNFDNCSAGEKTLFVRTASPNTVWKVFADKAWLKTSGGGAGDGQIHIQTDCSALAPGLYDAQLRIFVVQGRQQTIPVTLAVPPAQPPSVNFAGSGHQAVGNATLTPDSQGHLIVGNIGSSGSDGLQINFGRPEEFRLSFDSAIDAQGTTDGTTFDVIAIDQAGQVLASLLAKDIGAAFSTEVNFFPLGSSTYTLRAFRMGNLVYEEKGRNPKETGFFGKILPYVEAQDLNLRVLADGALQFTFRWPSIIGIEIPTPTTSQWQIDKLEIQSEPGKILPDRTPNGLILRFSNIPQRIIADEALVVMGREFRGLGAGKLLPAVNRVDVSNLGLFGTDGVAADLGGASSVLLRLDQPASLNAWPVGGSELVTAVGPMYDPLWTLEIERHLAGYDFRYRPAAALDNQTLRVLKGDQVLIEMELENKITDVSALVPPTEFTAEITSNGSLVSRARWLMATSFQTQNGVQIQGDTLMWVAKPTKGLPPGSLLGLRVQGKALPSFGIIAIDVSTLNPVAPILIAGVRHSPLGNATLNLEQQGAVLSVGNLTASGDDGVRIQFSDRDEFAVKFDTAISGLNVSPHASFDIAVVDPSNPNVTEPPFLRLHGVNANRNFKLTTDFSGAGSTAFDTRLYEGDTLRGESRGPNPQAPAAFNAFYFQEQPGEIRFRKEKNGNLTIVLRWSKVEGVTLPQSINGTQTTFASGDRLEISTVRAPNASALPLVGAELRWSHIGVRRLIDLLPKPCVRMQCPADMVVPCEGAGSAVVSYTVQVANDCGGDLKVTCVPQSGSVFLIGTTPVLCSAVINGVTNNCAFKVTVLPMDAHGVPCGPATTVGPAIKGRIADASGVPLVGVRVDLSGKVARTTKTDGTGYFVFEDLAAAGDYTARPTEPGYLFVPPEHTFQRLTQSATADFSGVTPFQQWLGKYQGGATSAKLSDPYADSDGDGIVNLHEYAFGSDPTDPRSGQAVRPVDIKMVTEGDGPHIEITLAAAGYARDVEFVIEKARSLDDKAWVPFPSMMVPFSGDPFSLVTPLRFRDPEPIERVREGFYRVTVRPIFPSSRVPSGPHGESIRIGFYNIQFLFPIPGETTSGCCEDIPTRPEQIASRVRETGYDIIGFAEAFTSEAQDRLAAALRRDYPYFVQDVDGPSGIEAGRLRSSGLMLFSRLPFEPLPTRPAAYTPLEENLEAWAAGAAWTDVAFVPFGDDCSSENNSDCLADKGAALVRIRNPETGRIYNVVFTHLDAGGTDADKAARARQLPKIEAMITTVLGDRLRREDVFLLGDLNIDGNWRRGDRDHSEWASYFGSSAGFFSTVLHDAWETQTAAGTLPGFEDFRDQGVTDISGTARFDYLFLNRPPEPALNPQLCVQHMAVAYGLRYSHPAAGVPLTEAAFGWAGVQDLSDHYGIIADINTESEHCSPATALANPDLVRPEPGSPPPLPGDTGDWATPLPGELDRPGDMYWMRFDESGTYSFAIAGLDPGVEGIWFHVYRSQDLSRPLLPLEGRTRRLRDAGTGQPVTARVFHVPSGPFFVRIAHPNRAIRGRYVFYAHRHEGASPEDALQLAPNASPAYRFAYDARSFGTSERWFRFDTERADSGRGQTLHAFARGADAVATELKLLAGDHTSILDERAAPPGELTLSVRDHPGGETLFLLLKPREARTTAYEVGWDTNLTVLTPSTAGLAPASAQALWLQCVEQNDLPDFLGEDDDDIILRIKLVVPGEAAPRIVRGPHFLLRDWDTGRIVAVDHLVGTLRFLPDEQLIVQLIENDDADFGVDSHDFNGVDEGADDCEEGKEGCDFEFLEANILPLGSAASTALNQTAHLHQVRCPESCTGDYAFRYHLTHGSATP